jgi:hypothetical protein
VLSEKESGSSSEQDESVLDARSPTQNGRMHTKGAGETVMECNCGRELDSTKKDSQLKLTWRH